MTYGTYLKSSLIGAFIVLVATGLIGFVLTVAGAGWTVALLVCGMVLLAALAVNVLSWLQRRAFFGDLERAASRVEHPLWIAEMVDRPDFAEGEVVYDALRAISKSANDDVASCQRQVADYREYIETWVHEAKSPLAAAHLMLENLTESIPADGDPTAALKKAEALDEELDRVERYIEQALFFARSETLDRDYLIRKHSLDSLVTTAIKANARAMIAARMAPVRCDLDMEVFTDDKWMEFILGQLIQNSVKYAREDGATVEFRGARRHEGSADECVELTVSDNGVGVSAADLPRVFDRGFTGSNGRVAKRSTGIGLYLVKRLCDKMGIGVEARSEQGAGFAVTLTFPSNKMHYFEHIPQNPA